MTIAHYIAKINDIMARPKTDKLSRVHARILSALTNCLSAKGFASISDLVEFLRLAGASSILPTLKIMERNGFVEIVGGGTRGKRINIMLTTKGKIAAGIGGVPVLGSIPAGLLVEAIESCTEVEELGTALPYKAGDFLLVVNGNSMTGDGIFHGDRVLLRPGVRVQSGEIAAVQVGHDYLCTLKHVFEESDGTVTLRASNEEFPDVRIDGSDIRVAGVFRGLVRTT